MNSHDLLAAFGENIFERIIEDTNPGDAFLLSIIDPYTFNKLKEKTGDFQQVENALKYTGRLNSVPDDYIAISVASLQVSLIYSDINITDDSFYSRVRAYYPNLKENLDILRYFEGFQEQLWKKVENVFLRKERYLRIPPRKTGSGRYVQFPKSQQLIRWHELAEYADKFIEIKLEPSRILSLEDFCNKVHIEFRDDFSREENEVIQKIVFSFYNKWDGRKADEIRTHRFRTKNLIHGKSIQQPAETELTINFNYEGVYIYKNDRKISEDELLNRFENKLIIPFVFDEDYEDWKHTRKILQTKDRLLVLINKSYKKYPEYFEGEKRDDLRMKHFYIFIFETCNNEVAEFVNLNFDKKEIYTIIGGIKANNKYNFVNNVLGCWYDFALPKIKINVPSLTKVLIDSKEITIEKRQVDLSNLTLKKTNQKYQIEPCKHSFQCFGISPAYFFVEEYKANASVAINQGWIITSNDLRPVKNGEKPNIIGLKAGKSNGIINTTHLRPFLSRNKYLQDRLLERLLNKKVMILEERKNYGC